MCDPAVKKNTYFISWLRAFAVLFIILCHYMFVLGPLPLMFFTSYWALNSLMIVAVSFAFATALHLINSFIQKKLLKSDYKPKTTA